MCIHKTVKRKTVRPASATGYNMTLLQLAGVGPKWTVTCGECLASFTKRLPLVDNPGLVCPHCGVVNQMTGIKWE